MGYKRDANLPKISARAIHDETDIRSEFRPALRAIERMEKGEYDFSIEREAAAMADRAIEELNRVIEEHVDPILRHPGGSQLLKAARARRKTFGDDVMSGVELVDGLKRFLKAHVFAAQCPICHGGKCGECRGEGWVTHGRLAELKGRV